MITECSSIDRCSDLVKFKSYYFKENTLTDSQIKSAFEYYIKNTAEIGTAFSLFIQLEKGSQFVGYGVKASDTYASVSVQSYALPSILYGVMQGGIWTWK